jgi:hypothetical protein
MPTVLRLDGFELVIRSSDHAPPHVHVFKAGSELKVELSPLVARERYGMTNRDAARAERIVATHAELLLAKWEEIHGPTQS